ncbi:MAG: hypothetical protein WB810_01540 [Candidatus Cybelea sp.]
MVRSLVLQFASGVALVSMSLAALPSTASAQATGQQFKTAITEVYGSTYPLTGRLDLELFPSGTLRGFYHTTFDKLFIPVAGGRDGDYIWFDIGPSSVDLGLGAGPQGKLHVVATMSGDGSFKGQVYPETAAVLSGLSMQFQFNSPPPNQQNSDQYMFAATPATDLEATPHPY